MNWIFGQQDDYDIAYKKLGKKLCSIGFKDIFIVNAQDLIDCNLEPYWGQRAKDEVHINVIAQGIKNSNGLFHPIILANIKPRREISILDGQHRYIALSKISETQRKMIDVQVDVINFDHEDDKWILTQYEWINTAKGITANQLQMETDVARLVDECTKYFGKLAGGYSKIDDFIQKNKNNSRLDKKNFKEELLKRIERIDFKQALNKIIEYNEHCDKHYDTKFKSERIGSKTFEECVKRKFWLGINFPAWLDDIF
jgi:hypothetical protein